jgi:hypothetical protein
MVSPTEMGWKITIKNSDGTSNEVILEPKAPEHTDTTTSVPPIEDADPENAQQAALKDPAKVSVSYCSEFCCTALLTLIAAIAKTPYLPYHSIHP